MARLDIPLTHFIDAEDVEAFKRDLIRIYERYGLEEEDCPPHLRAERARAIHRANETLRQCFKV